MSQYESIIRIIIFLVVFAVMALWELWAARRELSRAKSYRWLNNGAIIVLDSFILRIVFPSGGVGISLFADSQGWGVLNIWNLPFPLQVALSVVFLDFAVWLQHVIFHRVPILWRFHRMHHSDLDFDVTTGLRFHPIEMIISMFFKAAAIVLLGAPGVSIVLFEILLNATSMFNHSNIRIPQKLEKILRTFLVTPEMHRVHHSVYYEETNSNYGFNLPWWDLLFKTYIHQPKDGHENMQIGLETFRNPSWLRVDKMLSQPFTNRPDDTYSKGNS